MAIEHQMIDSWKQFWSSEESRGFSLCLLGIIFGLTIGVFSKDWAESFHSVEVIGYHIPPPLSFGITAGFAVQIVSVLSIRSVLLNRNDKLDNLMIGLLFTIPFGILTIFNVFSDRLVSFGFICSYISALMPFPIMIIVGMDAMCFLMMNALYLLPFYIVSTGVVWLMQLSRSIV
jgi:hypothetical protein